MEGQQLNQKKNNNAQILTTSDTGLQPSSKTIFVFNFGVSLDA
jgi:hypothetical protein